MLWLSPIGSADDYLCKPADGSSKLDLGGKPWSDTCVSLRRNAFAPSTCHLLSREEMLAPSTCHLLAAFFPFLQTANGSNIIYTLYLELNFLSLYSADEKVPCQLPRTFLIWHRAVKTLPIHSGRKYTQKDGALWRYKIHSGTSTVSKSVIWMGQEFYQVNNKNKKSSRETKKAVNFS